MGQLYILKLRGRKWYVGYTDRAITRILQHAEKKGAKWTKKHPPVNPIPYWMSEPGYSKEDENRKTLALPSHLPERSLGISQEDEKVVPESSYFHLPYYILVRTSSMELG